VAAGVPDRVGMTQQEQPTTESHAAET
jgi:hypothetical protein